MTVLANQSTLPDPMVKHLQLRLSGQVLQKAEARYVSTVGGVDVAVDNHTNNAVSAVSVFTYPELELNETSIASKKLSYPYIPGFLALREGPIILEAVRNLSIIPDLLIFDGQGIAHPRRLGIASHIGLITNIPSIGCAKNRLCGIHKEPDLEKGAWTPLKDGGEIIGAALRTRMDVKPLYISIGHRIDLETSIQYVLACCKGYRLPEPIRCAHHLAGDKMRELCHSASCA